MNLFRRIFLTFFFVIIGSLLVAGLSFRAVREGISENRFKQQRAFEIGLLNSAVAVFQARGAAGVRETLQDWHNTPSFHNILIVAGDRHEELFNRPIETAQIVAARKFAAREPETRVVRVVYDHLGEEYIFMLRNWYSNQAPPQSSLMTIPGLELSPVWHELIILLFIVCVGLLLSYILANNISRPIKILGRGMDDLAEGCLDTRIAHRLTHRRDELAHLAEQFDKMAADLQRLVEKERHLLHHVSHEMRSPLARMQALMALMQVQPEKQAYNMQRLEAELTRMDGLVGELLTLSRLEAAHIEMEKQPLDLIPFLEQLVCDCRVIAAEKGQEISFEAHTADGRAIMAANENYLYRSFDNIIRNAVAYSPDGSRIRVVLHGGKHHYRVEISDNGPGVAEHELPHIFTAFYRAESGACKPGTGLGLPIARHVAEKHGGTLTAENGESGGLKLTFTLPALSDAAAEGQGLPERIVP